MKQLQVTITLDTDYTDITLREDGAITTSFDCGENGSELAEALQDLAAEVLQRSKSIPVKS